MRPDADLVIRNGTVIDGSGTPARVADVAVKDGRVLAVGPALRVNAAQTVDAAGLAVTPGFIDIHTHYDGQATWEHTLSPSTGHGVTTVVTGNCGVGFAPCRPADRERLVKLMEGIEDLPEIVLATGIPWNWQSFPEYLDVLAARQFDCDIATQLPHAALRVFAMGQRAVDREPATPEDCARMAALAGEAIDAGALGFATSRTVNHRASDGIPVPTLTAAEDELATIGAALGRRGKGVLQLVSDFADTDSELPMLRRIAARAGRPMSLSLMQWHHVPDKWRTVLDWISACNADGVRVRAQVSGRPIGLNLGFELSFHPFTHTPTWRGIAALPLEARRASLRDPAVRERMLTEIPVPSGMPGEALLRHWSGMYPLGEKPFYEPAPDQSVASRAAQRGITPEQMAFELLMEQDAQATLMVPSVNFAGNSLEAAREMLCHPHAVYGLGDGGAHLGFLCDASLPTHMLEYWVRERTCGPRIPLEEVVHGWTQRAAETVGLQDRGRLAPGFKADINMIDTANVALLPPRVRYDLPAGGRRMVQDAKGYVATLVSGEVVRRNGEFTGALPGRLVRGVRSLISVLFAVSLLAVQSFAADMVARRLPPADAPNVVVVLLDDVGFGATGTFGGAIESPALDALARDGLRFNRFHTTAICSPTRAALLTGRNPHATGVGSVMNTATTVPGYTGVLRDDTATIATVLGAQGYATSAWGKWHLVPDWEASQTGPFTRWPTGQGFDTFYGFLGGETDQYQPTLYSGTNPVVVERQPGYHLSEDLADQAIAWMQRHRATDPARPFFLYFAPGAAHAPLQPPSDWLERYRGRFDRGWDALREDTFARQKALGVIPADTVLTPRPEALPAWSSLSAAEQRTSARLMELYAAFLGHTDAQVGRLREALSTLGVARDTLFVYIVGDNGASAEGGLSGSSNYMGSIYGFPSDLPRYADRPGDLRGGNSYAHFNAAWAWATNSPFQWSKQVASHLGGTRNAMVLSWPARVKGGGIRSQFAHVNDIVPTILEATGITLPPAVRGVPQRPLDGHSLVYAFDHPDAAERHRTQYFEIYGNRAIYHDGWIASAFRGRLPWEVLNRVRPDDFEADPWELYDLRSDYSQSRDLAAREPDRLREMQQLFAQEAARNGVVLHNPSPENTRFPNLAGERRAFSYGAGMIGLSEKEAPNTRDRSHVLEARIVIPDGGARGVIATLGGRSAGWSLFVDHAGFATYRLRVFDAEEITLRSAAPLAPGPHVLRYSFTTEGTGRMRGGLGVLSVDGKEAGRARVARAAATFSIDETFDVGLDTGSAPADYRPPFAFTGTLQRFDITLP